MPRRIVVCGGPRTGKTTISERLQKELGIATLHSSAELESLFPSGVKENWSASSEYASKWFDEESDSVLEGVRLAHALRKWLKANPGKPLDADIFLLRQPMVAQRDGQKSMMKAVETVFHEIEGELIRRGARVQKLKDPNNAIEVLRSAVPINSDAEAVPVPKFKLKAKVEKLEDVVELYRPAYVEREGAFHLDPEKLEAIEFDDKSELANALENERKTSRERQEKLELLKDVDPEEYKRLKAESDERAREGKKKSGDWEGWKQTFEESKQKEIKALEDKITERDKRIRKFLLEDKVRASALENGVRKESVERVVRDLLHPDNARFRLDDKEQIEVLDGTGRPMDLKIDSFFKDMYSQEAKEFYEGNGVDGGSGASNNGNGSRSGARVVSRMDQAALNANLEAIAKGEITVQE